MIYEVVHLFDGHDPKDIGFFSSKDSADAAIRMLRDKPGFCEAVDGFIIIPHFVSAQENDEIYDAWVYYHTKYYSYEYIKRIGFFTNESEANEAVALFEEMNSGTPKNLEKECEAAPCGIDRVGWAEGFTWERR